MAHRNLLIKDRNGNYHSTAHVNVLTATNIQHNGCDASHNPEILDLTVFKQISFTKSPSFISYHHDKRTFNRV
jgi:hypothetical protein